MNAIRIMRESLRLLSRRDRWILGLVTALQMATGFLDLAGVLLLGVVSVLSVAVVSGTPLPAQVTSIIDRFGWQDADPALVAAWLCAAAGVALVAKSLISIALSRWTLHFLASRQAALSGRLTQALLSRPLLEIQSRSSQDVAFIVTMGTQAAVVGVLGAATVAMADVALLIVLGAGLATIDPVVTVFAATFFALIAIGLTRALSGWARRIGEISTAIDIESYTAIQEALASYREVMVLDRRAMYVERIQRLRWTSAEMSADGQFISIVPKFVFEIALVVGAIALAVSQVATRDLAAAVGIVAVFLVAGSRIMPALLRLQVTGLTIRKSEAPASKAYDLARDLHSLGTDDPPRIDSGEIRSRIEAGYPDFEPTIVVDGVWLTYPGVDAPAVADISFSAPAGSSVAFVGSTGAGKSTLADLILGVVEADRGHANIGGRPAAEAVRTWPGGIAYVPQEVSLVNGTVRDNVALGLPRDAIDDDRIWEALRDAHLDVFLRANREGLETRIGEHGVKFSGGQRQRLGVARALYTRPRLLVLDEATSALDSETEDAIARTMRGLEGSVTTVTIAHRLATVRHCDLVLYLEGGQVKGRGTFEEVRAQSLTFDRQAQLLGL
jgi:ABC-type multidrug transport system fused ATPase/permease subunit